MGIVSEAIEHNPELQQEQKRWVQNVTDKGSVAQAKAQEEQAKDEQTPLQVHTGGGASDSEDAAASTDDAEETAGATDSLDAETSTSGAEDDANAEAGTDSDVSDGEGAQGDADDDPKVLELKKTLKKERTKIRTLETEKSQLSNEVEKLQEQLKSRNDADMAHLSDDDKAIVMDFAGGEEATPGQIFAALTKCRKHNLLKSSQGATRPKANRERVASGQGTNDKPRTWDEADRQSGIRTG